MASEMQAGRRELKSETSANLTTAASVVIASTVVAAAALSLALRPDFAQEYPDFIAGYIAGEARSKFQDLIAVPAFIAAGLFAFWFLTRLTRRLDTKFGRAHADAFTRQLILWSTPAAAAVGGLIFATTIDMRVLVASAAGVVLVALLCAQGLRASEPLSPATVGLALLACVFFALIPVELLVVLNRVGGRTMDPEPFVRAATAAGGAGLLLSAAAIIWAPQHTQRRLPGSLALAQLGLPAFYFALRPTVLRGPGGEITTYNTTIWLTILTFGLFGLGAADVLRRFWRGRKSEIPVSLLLSPLALIALIVAFRVGGTVVPHVPDDDYHFGELLAGASYGPGAVHFVDYQPPHGLLDDLPELVSKVFYDGTAVTVMESTRISFALLAIFAFISIWKCTGSLGIAFLALLFVGGQLIWPLLVGFLCLWINPALMKSPARWLIVWGLTVPLVILGTPGQGLVLVGASGILAIGAVRELWRDPEKRRWPELTVAAVLMAAALAFTPLAAMLLGAFRYVLENSRINQLAYGVASGVEWPGSVPAGLPLELIRMSWVAIPIVCVGTIYLAIRKGTRDTILPAVVVLLFSLLLIPYGMGRIDPEFSRPGLISTLGWSMLIPVVAMRVTNRAARPALALGTLVVAAAFNYTVVGFGVFTPIMAADTAVPATRNGAAAGLERLGRGVVEDEHWDRLLRLRELLTSHLKPDETYLDLSNRNAHYFYMKRRPPAPVTAVYNTVPIPQQRRMVADLAGDPPPLVLLEADNLSVDGISHALRAPVLYRFVIENYVPTWENGFVVGYPAEKVDLTVPETVKVPIKNVTDDAWEAGVSRGGPGIQVADVFPIRGLNVGSRVRLSNGQPRRITRVEPGGAVWLDGPTIGAEEAGSLLEFDLTLEPGPAAFLFRTALLERSFGPAQLAKLPVSWGKSERSLVKKMDLVRELPEPKDASGAEVKLDLSQEPVSGSDAGLLRLDFECRDRTAEPRVVVGWSGMSEEGIEVEGDLRLTGDDGVLIVPLYGYPRWFLLEAVREVSISLEDPAACGSIGVDDASLHQPDMLQGA